MQCSALLADSVAASEGKLYVHGGGWTTIWSQQVPFRWSRIGIALLFTVSWLEANDHHAFVIRLENEDGHLIALGLTPPDQHGNIAPVETLSGDFFVGRPPGLPDGEDQQVPVAINIDGIELPGFGAYRFVIGLDGNDVAALRFRVAAPSA